MRIIALTSAALLAACGAETNIQRNEMQRTINVTGEAKASATPDVAMLSFSVRAQAKEAGTAFTQSSTSMNAVIAALDEMEIEARDRQTGQLRLNPIYARDRNSVTNRSEVIAYEAVNTLTVRLRDIEKAGAVIDKAVGAGANGLDSFRFSVSETDELMAEARIAAVEDAREKAEAMAEAAGARLGDVLSISAGNSGSPRPVMMRAMAMEDSMSAAPSLQAGEQDFRVTVNATFELQ